VTEPLDVEDGVVVPQRVVSVVVTKRTLGLLPVRCHPSDESEFGFGEKRMGSWPGTGGESAPSQEGCQHDLRHVLRERRDGRESERRRAAQKDRHRERLSGGLCDRMVEASSLADLPVHARGAPVVDLHPVDTKVAPARAGCVRRLGVDERQRQKRPPVLGP
jgi:hypothetical protein